MVKFTKDNIPTIGANGFLIRKNTLLKHADVRPDHYFHIDVNVDLIKKGFNTYAFTKDSITHLAGHGSVGYYLVRRMKFVKQYYLVEGKKSLKHLRRYSLYEGKDFWRLFYFIVIGLTFIVPFIDSIRGYRKIHDTAWFVHPILCFSFVVIYGYVVVENQVKLLLRKFV